MMYFFIIWFGDSPLLEAYTEAVLEFLISVMVYISVRLLMGKTPGFIAASIYGILPYNIVRLTDTGYDTFISALFCLAFMFIVITAYMYAYNKLSGSKAYILPILAGGFSGFCAYVDKSGLILIFFAIECFLVNKPVASEKDKNSVKLSAILISICSAFAVCFIVGLFIINYDLKIPCLENGMELYLQGYQGMPVKAFVNFITSFANNNDMIIQVEAIKLFNTKDLQKLPYVRQLRSKGIYSEPMGGLTRYCTLYVFHYKGKVLTYSVAKFVK